MGVVSLFATLFGLLFLLASTSKERAEINQATKRADAHERERAEIEGQAVDKDLDHQIRHRVRDNETLRNAAIKKCNDKLNLIPGFEGCRLRDYYDYCVDKVDYIDFLVAMELAEHGKVSFWTLSRSIPATGFRNLFSCAISDKQMIAFFKWYERELRRHGFNKAMIKAVTNAYGEIQFWFFEGHSVIPLANVAPTKRMW